MRAMAVICALAICWRAELCRARTRPRVDACWSSPRGARIRLCCRLESRRNFWKTETKSSSGHSAKGRGSVASDWAVAGGRSCLPSLPDESALNRLSVLGRISRDRKLSGFSGPAFCPDFRLRRPLIAYGGSVDRAIEELIEQLQQFLLSEDLYWAVRIRLIKDELPEI